jgi:hypothetical protein
MPFDDEFAIEEEFQAPTPRRVRFVCACHWSFVARH